MSRLELQKEESASPEFQEYFRSVRERGLTVLNLYKMMAHSPEIGLPFLRLGSAILFQGVIPPTLRELAILRVGILNKANYEYTQHVKVALMVGVPQEKIDALTNWEKSDQFSDIERAVLRFTDEETVNVRVSDETFAAVRAFFDDQGIVELTSAISYYCMVCRNLEVLQIELEKTQKGTKFNDPERWTELMPKDPAPGEPRDVANLVAFLASDCAQNITGTIITVDGGVSAAY
jgi:alkylhydroperoxidase family enzyme